MEPEEKGAKKPASGKLGGEINYYVLAGISVGIIIFIIGNSVEPEIDSELDFYEASITVGFGAAAGFGFVVAKRYWGTDVFGRAYLALSIGFAAYFAGWVLWFVYEIGFQVENPYPYFPDIGYFAFYPFAIYHLRTNIKYFKRSLARKQKAVIIVIPIITCSVYAFFGLVEVDATGGFGNLKITPIEEHYEGFEIEYLTGLAFTAATTLTFSYAVVGTQIFRTTVLGAAWGLLLIGIALNTGADIYYYINELFGGYVRADPVTGIWVAATMVVCYALFKHRKEL